MTSARAAYGVVHVLPQDVLCLADLNVEGRPSLTNDAERVIEDLVGHGFDLATSRVIYRDSMGVWDEMLVREQRFAGFASLGTLDFFEAIRRVKGAAGEPRGLVH